MDDAQFGEKLEDALRRLRAAGGAGGLEGFEREVWAEVAVRERGGAARVFRWFRGGSPTIPNAVAAACAVAAFALGAAAALDRAERYAAEASLAMEARYVASIHPVLRSESLHAVADHP
jgi:hypothetical protein